LKEKPIPTPVSSYVKSVIKAPALLIGCRATKAVISKPCCEYDIVVLTVDRSPNQVVKLDSHNSAAELLHVSMGPLVRRVFLTNSDAVILNDTHDLRLSSIKHAALGKGGQLMTMSATARRLLISCLLRHYDIERFARKSPLISSMLLKICAYEILEGVLLFSGKPTSPLHQMELLRQPVLPNQVFSESISLALQIIGVERATMSVLRRCFPAYSQLALNSYDKSLINEKIRYLYESGFTTDCYYYIGRMCSEILKLREIKFWKSYSKLIQIGMDLSLDVEILQKWNSQLSVLAKALIRNHRTVIVG
jgi:hypothetical protein